MSKTWNILHCIQILQRKFKFHKYSQFSTAKPTHLFRLLLSLLFLLYGACCFWPRSTHNPCHYSYSISHSEVSITYLFSVCLIPSASHRYLNMLKNLLSQKSESSFKLLQKQFYHLPPNLHWETFWMSHSLHFLSSYSLLNTFTSRLQQWIFI